jgi:hypothetical protein
MTAYGRRLQRPFALSAYGRSSRPNGLQLSPPFCGAQFTSVAGLRVDSPWTAAQSCEGPSGTGLRLSTVCPH